VYFKVKNIQQYITPGTGLIEHYIFRPIIAYLIYKFKFNINPNLITIFSLFYAIFCSILILTKKYAILGAFLYIFFGFIDLLDGAIARFYNRKSKLGAFLDGLVDLLAEIIILISLGYYFNKLNYFLFLASFILFSHYLSIRLKWIYGIKERQTNIFNYINNPIHFFILLLKRNDTRKIFLVIGLLLNSWKFILFYFLFIYIISIFSTIKIILNGGKYE